MHVWFLRFVALYPLLLIPVRQAGIYGAPLCPRYRLICSPEGKILNASVY